MGLTWWETTKERLKAREWVSLLARPLSDIELANGSLGIEWESWFWAFSY